MSSSGGQALHVGTTNRNAAEDSSVSVAAVERVSHPKFVLETYAYDFLVIKLSGWVSFGRRYFLNRQFPARLMSVMDSILGWQRNSAIGLFRCSYCR